jgi:transglutaminase-like putative cysteine protease
MIANVHARLRYRLPVGCNVILRIAAARSTDQTLIAETLDSGGVAFAETPDAHGRMFRARAEGELAVDYRATVAIADRPGLAPGVGQDAWSALPGEVYPHLLPSRFCPSDQFLRFAARAFGALDGSAKVLAILDWIHANIDYVAGASDAATTAADTFVDRAGVCRDFTHLAITLIRAAGIPARAVAAYAVKLDPPDFHAVVEVWLGGQWWLLDPTRRAPVAGLIRIADGRDAADIAFLTTSAAVEFIDLSVMVRV